MSDLLGLKPYPDQEEVRMLSDNDSYGLSFQQLPVVILSSKPRMDATRYSSSY